MMTQTILDRLSTLLTRNFGWFWMYPNMSD